MRVALYARCSTSGQSVDLQLDGLRDYAKARGFDVVGEYLDEAVSGAKARTVLRCAALDVVNATHGNASHASGRWQGARCYNSPRGMRSQLSAGPWRERYWTSFSRSLQ